MRYFIIKIRKSMKQNINIKSMNRKIYLVIIPLIITACGGSNENKEKLGTVSLSVNSAMVEVTEVVGVGKVEPEKEIISLAAPTGGVVKEIYRNDGDSIKKDEPLVRLDDELELIRVSQLRRQYNTQKSQEDIDELNLRESEARLANKKRLLESVRVLALKGAETKQTLDDLETEVTTLSLTVKKDSSSVKLSTSRLRELAEQVRYAEAEASRKILRSPYDGVLLELQIEKGSAVNLFESFAEIAPSGPMTVRSEVDELFAGRLKLGQKANEQEDRLVREVRIKLEGDNGLILNSKVESVIKLKNNQL
jgi:multidrug resistance efflux pump